MKTFIFNHNDTSAVLTISAESYEWAYRMLAEIVYDVFAWRVENEEGEDGNFVKTAIREFSNGNIYKEEDSNKDGPKAELMDANGKILEKYEIKRIAGMYYRIFPDGHKERYNALIDN